MLFDTKTGKKTKKGISVCAYVYRCPVTFEEADPVGVVVGFGLEQSAAEWKWRWHSEEETAAGEGGEERRGAN